MTEKLAAGCLVVDQIEVKAVQWPQILLHARPVIHLDVQNADDS